MRTPGDEFWDGQRGYVVYELFDNEVIRHAEVGCGESPLRKREIDTIHAEGDLVLQLAHVGLLQAGTVADDEGAFAFVNILQRSKSTNALPPPGVKKRGGQLRDSSEAIVRVTGKLPQRLRDQGLKDLFHVETNSCGEVSKAIRAAKFNQAKSKST